VRGWAWPSRQIITFLLPDFFGNPTAHSYFDIWQRVWVPVTQNALGEPLNTIDWGVKNYVEGGNYLGLLTWLLGGIGVISAARAALRRQRTIPAATYQASDLRAEPEHGSSRVLTFVVLAVLSLFFAFGTPLYAVLYYLLPGYSQLHSAFRWVFPYTLSMAVLAGYGLDVLVAGVRGQGSGVRGQGSGVRNQEPGARDQGSGIRRQSPAIVRVLGWLAVLVGAAALLVVLVSVFAPGPFVALGDKLLAWSDLARTRGFADGAMAWSYEAVGIARLGLMAVLAGVGLLWATWQRMRTDKRMKSQRQPSHPFTPHLRPPQVRCRCCEGGGPKQSPT
jgi:hypothetical protein